ncbi:OmpA family protein [Bacteroidota bacterium]
MFSEFKKIKKKSSTVLSYWLSISDLMASILIIFILFFILKVNSESKIKRVYDVLFIKQLEIVEELKEKFRDNKNVTVLDDGTIFFFISEKGEMDTWFERGNWELKDNAKQILKEFAPQYLDILISKTNLEEIDIEKIIVEGHTDRTRFKGAKTELENYLYNLQLSQQRAFSVSKFIQEEVILSDSVQALLQKRLTANGRSYVIPFLNSDGIVDSALSRRVEFKFKLDWEKAFKETQTSKSQL